MATLYNLGRSSGRWDTYFRTDCTAITKKPLKWGAKNLDAFDAVAFFTDGDLDMDDSQKADLLSFVRDDGKGFIGIHSAAITFLSWPEYGKMLGGYFDGHPWGEFDAPLVVEDRELSRAWGTCPARSRSRMRSTRSRTSRARTSACCLRLDAGKVDLSQKGSPPQGPGLRGDLGPQLRQRARPLQRPRAIAGRSGIGPRSRRCGSRWCHGPWDSSRETPRPEPLWRNSGDRI